MFRYLRGIALIAAIMVNCGATFAKPDQDSANYIMPGCRDFITHTLVNPFMNGRCAGILETLVGVTADVCHPAGVTVGQTVRVVVKYIDDRPARLNEKFRTLAYEALRAAWPCKK